MEEKPKPKRDWKKYEAELKRRSAKRINFLFRKPSKAQLEKELRQMNRGKQGRVFEIPESVVGFSVFFKTSFHVNDRDLAKFLRKAFGKDISFRELDHSSIVKRRQDLQFSVPFDLSRENLEGKTIYFDGTCMRLERGGNYRSKKYGTKVKYMRIGVFTDDKGKVIDLTIGDEHDPEVEMIREKLPAIEKSGAAAFNSDGAGSSKDIVCRLTKAKIRPIIRASVTVVGSKKNAPPPYLCIKEKKEDDIIWDNYAKAQEDYQKWRKETGYSMRWVFTEGRFSALKRMQGEEIFCRTQKAIHDEVCARLMLLDGNLPDFWA
jgi:hypothetical protein